MISALTWIKRGACAAHPRKVDLSDAEFAKIAARAGVELEDAKLELQLAQEAEGAAATEDLDDGNWEEEEDENDDAASDESMADDSDDEDDDDDAMEVEKPELAEYNLDDYDAEPDNANAIESVNIFSNIKSMTFHDGTNGEDPYLQPAGDGEDSDEDEDLAIGKNDNVLVIASTADDISVLEFQVLEGPPADDDDDDEDDGRANLYTHHDLMLPTFPLAVEWFNYVPGSKTELRSTSHATDTGAFIAVAGFTPDIELWDVDVVDAMVPTAVLGAPKTDAPQDKAKKRALKKANDAYHVDAVLALSWNTTHRNFLASGSADTTVKIWDLDTLSCVRSFVPHAKAKGGAAKVGLTKWAPTAPTCLLTGAHDRSLRFFDTRTPHDAVVVKLRADPEDAAWNTLPGRDTEVYVATEDGHVQLIDLRNAAAPKWTLSAHQGGATSSLSLTTSGRTLASVGADKTLKVWNVAEGKPALSHSRQLQLGPLFACSWCPDQEGVIAVGGARGSVVLDLHANATIHANAGDRGEEDEDDDSDDE
ncbi:hypothetical protein GGF32_009865 [Allomyces javanicus]|nr:hypothetical protein GGF32_009865 [Allomyces javanicus]